MTADEELIKRIQKVADALGEHVESVQILCSWSAEGGGTQRCFRGSGNWFARIGMANLFVKSSEAEETADVFAYKFPRNDE